MAVLRVMDADNQRALIDLEVAPDQQNMVAPNAITMAQSIFRPGSEVFGIFDGDAAVGLMAVIDLANPKAELHEGETRDSLYIWRLMVDAKQQRRGYGTVALDFAQGLARERGRRALRIAVVQDKGSALPVYTAYGFQSTGRVIADELQMVMAM